MKKTLFGLVCLAFLSFPGVSFAETSETEGSQKESEVTVIEEDSAEKEDSATDVKEKPLVVEDKELTEKEEPVKSNEEIENKEEVSEKPKEPTVVEWVWATPLMGVQQNKEFPLYYVSNLVPFSELLDVEKIDFADGAPDTSKPGRHYMSLLVTYLNGEQELYKDVPYSVYQVDTTTVTITDLSYNYETKVVSGKTFPNAVVAIELVNQDDGRFSLRTQANAEGYFEVKLEFEPSKAINAWVLYSKIDNYTEYSHVTVFDMVANKPVVKEEVKNPPVVEVKKPEATSTPKTGAQLPKTGETNTTTIEVLGVVMLTMIGSGYIYFNKEKA